MDECHYEWLVKMVELAVATDTFTEQRLTVPGLTLQDLSREEMYELSEVALTEACPILKAAELIDATVEAPC
jgi:hypothetical protein